MSWIMYSCCYVHPDLDWLILWSSEVCVGLCWLSGCGGVSEKQCVLSVSSSCINKRRSSVFHTPEPGDSHVPQLLHTRCLIVLFVYLAASFHFLCCWRWENRQQYSRDSVLPPSPFPLLSASSPSSPFPPSHLPLTQCLVLIRFPSHQSVLWERNCEVIHRATTMPMGSHVFSEHT